LTSVSKRFVPAWNGGFVLSAQGPKLMSISWKKNPSLAFIDSAQIGKSSFADDAARELGRYLRGESVLLDIPLDLASSGTLFCRAIWQTLQTVGFGQVLSYGDLAERSGLSRSYSRAVGQAVARNPYLVLVPCHRVLDSGGTLGGFSAGLELKRNLLNLEHPSGSADYPGFSWTAGTACTS
jgi:methylated-DNA-[protein]-cysteine S-methyltransferase